MNMEEFKNELKENGHMGMFEKSIINLLETNHGIRFFNYYENMIKDKTQWVIFLKKGLGYLNVDNLEDIFKYIEILTIMYIMNMATTMKTIKTYQYMIFLQSVGVITISDNDFDELIDSLGSMKEKITNYSKDEILVGSLNEFIQEYNNQTDLPLNMIKTIFIKSTDLI
jgi:hypothetical protein